MCQIIFLVGVSYSGYQLRYFTFQYSLSLPTRAGFQQLRERASAMYITHLYIKPIMSTAHSSLHFTPDLHQQPPTIHCLQLSLKHLPCGCRSMLHGWSYLDTTALGESSGGDIPSEIKYFFIFSNKIKEG